ncbi:unnamed protein product [Lactuca virosa]|uniref:PHD finger protein ALFIN-LIKE n=1 Tax=Lactuca virosa TaxID=75947 RepID=A0AAU9M4K3_9ASTR|nr:unnamed protein product [Lactuca virosa]
MASIPPLIDPLYSSLLRSTTTSIPATAFFHRQMPCLTSSPPVLAARLSSPYRLTDPRRPSLTVAAATTLMSNSVQTTCSFPLKCFPFTILFCKEKENLCLYGFPSEQWEVILPAEEVPPNLPEPALGINFSRDGMPENDWLSLVAVHSDAWLLSVAYYFGARFGFDKSDRYVILFLN